MSDAVVTQVLLLLEDGRSTGFRLVLAAAALLAPGVVSAFVLPMMGPLEGGMLLLATVVACSGAAIVMLRDQLVRADAPSAPIDVRELLAERLERRLSELASPGAMALMASAVCLVTVMTAFVGFAPPAPGLGWLTFVGGATALLMLGSLAWTWTVEVPRLAAALEELRASGQ